MTDKTLKNLTDIASNTTLNDSDIGYVVRPSTDADYKASLGTIKTYVNRKPQIVSTHNAIYNNNYAGTTGSRTDVQNQVRNGHYIGPSDVSDIQIGVIGFYTPQNNNTGDKAIGNSFSYEAAIEITSPAVTRNTYFGENKTVTVSDTSPLILSNPVNVTMAAGTQFYTRQGFILSAAAEKFPAYIRGSVNATNVLSPISTSQISATGALTIPGGGTSANFCRPQPAVILGIPKDPIPAVLVLGDSIAEGTGDAVASARGGSGFIRRGLEMVNGYSMPWHFQAVPGLSLDGSNLSLSPMTRDTWKYCTHAILQLGINNLSGSETLSSMQTKTTALLNELKRTIGPYGKPLHVSVTTMTPRTTSSNSFTDAAGQTVATSYFTSGGIRDQYNSWLLSLVGGNLVDNVIDLREATQDPGDHTKWFTTGASNFPTSDGTHPASGMVTRMAQVITNWASTIKP